MDKVAVIARLREHEEELRAAGVERLSIFGSVARGDATLESDLDVLVTLSEPVRRSGFGYFSALADLQQRIIDITGYHSVDVIAEPIQKERLRAAIEKDRALAF